MAHNKEGICSSIAVDICLERYVSQSVRPFCRLRKIKDGSTNTKLQVLVYVYVSVQVLVLGLGFSPGLGFDLGVRLAEETQTRANTKESIDLGLCVRVGLRPCLSPAKALP